MNGCMISKNIVQVSAMFSLDFGNNNSVKVISCNCANRYKYFTILTPSEQM